jgi:hypothetical protein
MSGWNVSAPRIFDWLSPIAFFISMIKSEWVFDAGRRQPDEKHR